MDEILGKYENRGEELLAYLAKKYNAPWDTTHHTSGGKKAVDSKSIQ